MTTALQSIAIKARTHPKHRFQNLYKLLDSRLLFSSWGSLNKHAASGIDNMTCADYNEGLFERLSQIGQKLRHKSYRSNAVKRIYIPKANGKQRPLGLPTVEDKLVQQSASYLLQSIWEQDFEPVSFGYRPKLSAHNALETLRSGLQQGIYGYVVEADIKGFFDNMNHAWLVKMLEQRVDDKAFINLIKQWLKSPIVEPTGQQHKPVKGVPQGGLISPVLANIYLHYVLDLWFEKVVKRRVKGKAMLIRYADDFVVAFQYRDDARDFYQGLNSRLKKFDLEVAPEKTRMIRFSRHHPKRENCFEFLGFNFRWGLSREKKAVVMLRTAKEKQKSSHKKLYSWIKYNRSLPIAVIMNRVKKMVQGFVNYFGVPGNSKSITTYQYHTRMTLFKWLNRRSQRRSYNWPEFNHLLQCFNVTAMRVRKRMQKGPALHGQIYN